MKKVTNVLATVALVGLTAACGQIQGLDNQQNVDAKDSVVASEYSALPQGVLVRVPMDAQGNPVMDQADMRTTDQANFDGQTQLESAFANGQTVSSVASVDELDRDSGTQSWHDWRRPRHQGYAYNYSCNLVMGYSSCGQYGYNQYQYNYSQYNYYGSQGCGSYQCSSYYMNNWRPAQYSNAISGGYWYYQQPQQYTYTNTCGTYCGYQYYYYQRPQCSSYSWCGSVSYNYRYRVHSHYRGCGHRW